jgi:hypothetical protein
MKKQQDSHCTSQELSSEQKKNNREDDFIKSGKASSLSIRVDAETLLWVKVDTKSEEK